MRERPEALLRKKQVLLQEMEHRVANSLQIIASILMIKARAVASEETRQHLRDAHQRVMSVAEVQAHLHASGGVDKIEVGGYLTKLCSSLAKSMVDEDRPLALEVIADAGKIGSDKAVSIGLIVTELMINAVKYAFPVAKPDAHVLITYASAGDGWTLTVADNGVGKAIDLEPTKGGGLGTVIVEALVKQLGATMEIRSTDGVTVTITHAATLQVPEAA